MYSTMIAFEIFGRPIHWYGIFYLITFLSGYTFLRLITRSSFFQRNKQEYQGLYHILADDLDDIFLVMMLGVIVWWRLGHVFFYDRAYYSQNLMEIIQINKWWMSFVGWVIGVILGLLYLYRKHRLTGKEFVLFGDLVVLVVPLWSLLWRLWNWFNQELYGKSLALFSESFPVIGSKIKEYGLTRVYDTVDSLTRIDTNIIQSAWEGWVLLILVWFLFIFFVRKEKPLIPWLISWSFLIWYWVLRFFFEYLKDLPSAELYGAFSISQILSRIMILAWIIVLLLRRRMKAKRVT